MAQLDDLARDLSHDERLDPLARQLHALAQSIPEAARPVLEGAWLGHAVHPFLTDIPIGCWSSANVLDLVGGRSGRKAAQRLMGLGVLSALPTATTGLAELGRIDDPGTRRVAATHALLNTGALTFYASSWLARRRGDHLRGVFHGLVGTTIATVSGFLGGHMSFALATGTGHRDLEADVGHPRIPDVDLSGDRPHPDGDGSLPRNTGPVGDAHQTTLGDLIS